MSLLRANAVLLLSLIAHWALADLAFGQRMEAEIMRAVTAVVNEALWNPETAARHGMLFKSPGLVVIPRANSGQFTNGGGFRRGVLLVRRVNESWQTPAFVTLKSENLDWKVGEQSDIFLIVKNPEIVRRLEAGSITLGTKFQTVSGRLALAGSVRGGSGPQVEFRSYSSGGGLGPISIYGAVLTVDEEANQTYYMSSGPENSKTIPHDAEVLTQLISATTDVTESGWWPHPQPTLDQPAEPALEQPAEPALEQPAELERRQEGSLPNPLHMQLSQFAPELLCQLDDILRVYLTIPSELLQPDSQPDADALRETFRRYSAIAEAPEYHALASSHEFQNVLWVLSLLCQPPEPYLAAR